VRVLSPTSLDQALEMLASADAPVTPIAGGTDLLVSWPHRVKDDLCLLDLSRVDALRSMELTAEHLQLGGLTTYWDVIASRDVGEAFPLLVEAGRQVGAIQIQTRGTWAGNIGNASPAADGVPVMMAYDATVTLRSRDGESQVRLDEYFTGYRQSVRRPDQLITAIRMPVRNREVEWFHKVGARSAQAITKVGVAVVRDDRGWRVVANSVAPVVCRCRNLEQALNENETFDTPDDIVKTIKQDVSPISDIRSTADYRLRVLSRLLFVHLSGDRARL
jgi:CO/xanthine dehydrogenase FAD-binding subunit